MAILATVLEKKIKDALADYNNGDYENERDNPQHLKILGDTMKNYFEENTEIVYSWAAVSPPPASTPDPTTSFQSEVNFSAFDLTPSRNLDDMALRIRSAFASAIITHPASFLIAPGSFLAIAPPSLGRISDMAAAETAILVCICVPVCAWVLTLINPAPLSGTHGSFVGATTGMVIK